MSPAEARRQAALKLGPAEAIREQHHAEHSIPLIENLLFDLRYAVRMLLRSPGFSFIAIATMALGIGATTAIYSVIDATLLHPLPYPNPAELVRIQDDLPGVGAQGVGISVPEWRDLESSGIFQSASITGIGENVNLTGSAQPLRLSFKQVTPNYFAVLGVDAQLGRTFDPHDATPGYNLEVVISDGLWRREFGADPHIIGKALRLDNDVYHVVGVPARCHWSAKASRRWTMRLLRSIAPSFRPNTSTCWACRCCADAFSATRTLRIRPRLRSSIRPRLAPTGQTRTRGPKYHPGLDRSWSGYTSAARHLSL